MYEKFPTPAEMEARGYAPSDYDAEFEVWPENARTYLLFSRFENQWNWMGGMGGAVRISLNLAVLPVFIARMALSDDEYEELLDDLRAMENAAIMAMNEKV